MCTSEEVWLRRRLLSLRIRQVPVLQHPMTKKQPLRHLTLQLSTNITLKGQQVMRASKCLQAQQPSRRQWLCTSRLLPMVLKALLQTSQAVRMQLPARLVAVLLAELTIISLCPALILMMMMIQQTQMVS